MEITLQQLNDNAKTAYKNADSTGKKLISDLFGSDLVVPKKITDRIKTWEDVCKVLSLDPVGSLPVDPKFPNATKGLDSVNGYFKLIKIAEVLNEGWEPNWDNANEPKYYPWFYMDSKAGSGFGLSYHGYVDVNSYSTVGSRLCFKTRELAIYAGQQFINEYLEYMKK